MRSTASLLRIAVAAILLTGCTVTPADELATEVVPSAEAHEIDGNLDCTGDITWAVEAARMADAQGAPTPEEALRQELSRYLTAGDHIRIDGGSGTVVSGDREVVRATAEGPVGAGGFFADSVSGCEGDKRPR